MRKYQQSSIHPHPEQEAGKVNWFFRQLLYYYSVPFSDNCGSNMSSANPSDLLNHLENILDSDPLIDEVGFIHPSQFAVLGEEAGICAVDGVTGSEESKPVFSGSFFLSTEHKLGISTDVILLLYKAAKNAFMEASRQYKLLDSNRELDDYSQSTCPLSSLSVLETELMRHSRALVMLSCDFGTAWNSRKAVISKKQEIWFFMDELLLSNLVLSVSPKSERAWSHRRWSIKMVAGLCSNLQNIIERESKLVEKMAERSKMNYRAWNHRSWLVSYMSMEQVVHELSVSQDWAGLHPADNSCFHYRSRLLLKLLECGSHKTPELQELWKVELDWIESLIKCYVGREALWLHRRFLALCWLKHFLTTESCTTPSIINVESFIDQELELFHSCSVIRDNNFEDYQAQAVLSATYIIWLVTQAFGLWGVELQKKMKAKELKKIIYSVCPEKSFLWDDLMPKCMSS